MIIFFVLRYKFIDIIVRIVILGLYFFAFGRKYEE
jgi:hypothetical protein